MGIKVTAGCRCQLVNMKPVIEFSRNMYGLERVDIVHSDRDTVPTGSGSGVKTSRPTCMWERKRWTSLSVKDCT